MSVIEENIILILMLIPFYIQKESSVRLHLRPFLWSAAASLRCENWAAGPDKTSLILTLKMLTLSMREFCCAAKTEHLLPLLILRPSKVVRSQHLSFSSGGFPALTNILSASNTEADFRVSLH